MTVSQAPPPVAELRALYARYKGLALAAGAAIVLGERTEALAAGAAALEADCANAAAAAQRELEIPLAACRTAAAELCELLRDASAGADVVDRVRASHRHLRSEVWKLVPCEYVPCAPGHVHGEDR